MIRSRTWAPKLSNRTCVSLTSLSGGGSHGAAVLSGLSPSGSAWTRCLTRRRPGGGVQ